MKVLDFAKETKDTEAIKPWTWTYSYILKAKANVTITAWQTKDVLTWNKIAIPEWYIWVLVQDSKLDPLLTSRVKILYPDNRDEISIALYNWAQWHAEFSWDWWKRVAWLSKTINKWTAVANLIIIPSVTHDWSDLRLWSSWLLYPSFKSN